ncbi:MAG: replicative DNA helicase [Patescibacteria group bacterium]|nr:replicative DNA helicase [Patescibacteria group bacterium]
MARPTIKKQSAVGRAKLKLPPQSIEAEESVLGSLLIDKDAITRVMDILVPEDFYKPANEKIFSAMLDLANKNQPVDIVSLTNRLKERGEFSDVGGSTYLADLANGVPSATHVENYAKIVRDKKILRDLIKTSTNISEKAFLSDKDTETILDESEQDFLKNVFQRLLNSNLTPVNSELTSFYERLEKLHQEGGLRGIPTGFIDLDKMLSGLQKSNFIVLGARPSLGKTSLVLDIARQAAVESSLPIALFSLEMSREQIIDRFVSATANIPLWKIRSGQIKEETDWTAIQQALDKLSKTKIFIDDTPSPTVNQIRSAARQMQMKHGLGLLIVDYLQLIQSKINSDNTVSQFTEISRGLKSLARELNIPVVAVSQLNRLVDQREVKIPRLSDLRETGAIEQDADIVLFIYRKDRDRNDLAAEEQNIAEIIVAKHRNGPVGNIKLMFNPEYASFRNLDSTHTDDQFA